MSRPNRPAPGVLIAVLAAALAAGGGLYRAAAQTSIPGPANQPGPPTPAPPGPNPAGPQFTTPTHSLQKSAGEQNEVNQVTAAGADLLAKTPASNLFPGGIRLVPNLRNPVANDPDAVARGLRYFVGLNCVGCHAPNGGGGMGPSLSNRVFKYGSEPAQIFNTIRQGRAQGMPAWATMLPDNVVWDLVAYIRTISRAPKQQWGTTVSPSSPKIEQVPAEYQMTTQPWAHTEPFAHGQKPEGRSQ